MLISVIIPVYNVEKYLDRCLESIVSQTYKNLEIILVNDGSPDRCPMMCEQWAKKDNRIKVLHKENGGLASARNFGLEHATGDYIHFCDSDDWLELDMFEELNEIAEKYSPDIIDFGYKKVVNGLVQDGNSSYYDEGFYEGEQVRNEIFPDIIAKEDALNYEKKVLKSACMKLYKRDKVGNIRFKPEKVVLNEDFLFNVEVYSVISSCYVSKEAFYCYDTREGSITQRHIENMYKRKQRITDEYTKVIEKIDDNQLYKQRVELSYVESMYNCIQNLCKKNYGMSYQNAKQELKVILCDLRLQGILHEKLLKTSSYKEKALVVLMWLKSPFLIYYAYKVFVGK